MVRKFAFVQSEKGGPGPGLCYDAATRKVFVFPKINLLVAIISRTGHITANISPHRLLIVYPMFGCKSLD